MIITRTPFRITLGGGGTDLPEYYEQRGGFVLSAAINKYMYVAVNRPKTDRLIHIKSRNFSQSTENLLNVQHDLAREILNEKGILHSIDVSSISDIDAGTGLGSSSCYAVGLLRALGEEAPSLPETDYRIERETLGRSIGKQDPYMASYGGIRVLNISTDGSVAMTKIELQPVIQKRLNKNLMLFFTGVMRDANEILKEQSAGMVDPSNYDKIKAIGIAISLALTEGDLDMVGKLFNEHWEYKKRTAANVSNSAFDALYDQAMSAGALGGKISGAGGGGFFLFYVPKQHDKFIQRMEELGLTYMPFKFEKGGSKIIYHD